MIIGTYVLFFGLLIGYLFFRHRGKIAVRVNRNGEEEVYWKKQEDYGQKTIIVMRKATKNKGGWSFDVVPNCKVAKRDFFHRLYWVIEVYPDSPKPIIHDYEQKKDLATQLTKHDIKAFANLEAIKARYSKMPQGPKQTINYLIFIVTIIILILDLLPRAGVRIG
jgi:hypothetical protein